MLAARKRLDRGEWECRERRSSSCAGPCSIARRVGPEGRALPSASPPPAHVRLRAPTRTWESSARPGEECPSDGGRPSSKTFTRNQFPCARRIVAPTLSPTLRRSPPRTSNFRSIRLSCATLSLVVDHPARPTNVPLKAFEKHRNRACAVGTGTISTAERPGPASRRHDGRFRILSSPFSCLFLPGCRCACSSASHRASELSSRRHRPAPPFLTSRCSRRPRGEGPVGLDRRDGDEPKTARSSAGPRRVGSSARRAKHTTAH